jgi:hypothetical protein
MDFNTENFNIEKNVFVNISESIRGFKGYARNIFKGDNVFLASNLQIICDDFSIGDYSKIQHNTKIHG